MKLKTKIFKLPEGRQNGKSGISKHLKVGNFCRTQEGPAYMRLSRFRPCVRLHIRFQFYPTRPIYLGPPIFLQIPDLLCIDY